MKRYSLAILLMLAASNAAGAQTYEGRYCTVDCSGHRAGYEWAQTRGVTDSSDCRGSGSYSFREGCESYLDNPYRDDTTVDDDGTEVPE